MALVVLIASAVAVGAPTALYALVLYWLDRYEKEPLGLMAIAFGWGAVPAAFLAIVVSLMFDVPLSLLGNTLADLISTNAVAPIIEECAKGFIVLVLFWGFSSDFDDPVDGIIYGALVGLGFAMVENLLYLLGAWASGGWGMWAFVLVLRTIVFGLNHAFFTSLTGLGFGLARLTNSRITQFMLALLGLAAAMSFHGLHNLGISLANVTCLTGIVSLLSDWGGILIVFVVMLLALRQEKKWLAEELREEVGAGILSAEEYALVCSSISRFSGQVRALTSGSWSRARWLARFTQTATRLAFKKHQHRTRGNDHMREIERLREQITMLRAEA